MKILTISNCPLVESQGSGYIIVNFTRGLQQRGHEIDLFGPDDYEPLQFLRGSANSYRQALGMLFFCLLQINKKQYDIIEFYGAESWLTVSVLHKLKNRSYLMISHSNGLETHYYEVASKYSKVLDTKSKRWYQVNQSALFTQAFTRVDGIVTVSQNERDYALKKKYQNPLNIITIENSLLNDYLKIININLHRDPIIAYCGSWLTNKGVQLIKNDISKILIEFPDSTLKLIGVGSNFKKEEHFSTEICNKIEVIPYVDRDKLKIIYQTASILIMTSIYESFNLVSAEAMACGCALVANKTGFAASLKHREEAMLIDQPLSPYLYEAVKELLLNESLRMKIAQMGYERVQNLRWDLAIDKLEMTYSEWLVDFRNKS